MGFDTYAPKMPIEERYRVEELFGRTADLALAVFDTADRDRKRGD